MSFSFSKDHRLLKPNDFNSLRSGSARSKAPHLLAYSKVNKNNLGKTRIGLAVSRRVGNASIRNFVKRQIREYFRSSNYRELGTDVLIIVNPSLIPSNEINNFKDLSRKLKASLESLFNSINVKTTSYAN